MSRQSLPPIDDPIWGAIAARHRRFVERHPGLKEYLEKQAELILELSSEGDDITLTKPDNAALDGSKVPIRIVPSGATGYAISRSPDEYSWETAVQSLLSGPAAQYNSAFDILANTHDIPLRVRNIMLLAAGIRVLARQDDGSFIAQASTHFAIGASRTRYVASADDEVPVRNWFFG